MTHDNITQIISFLRSNEYVYLEKYFNDYTNAPRPTYNFLIMKEGRATLNIGETEFIFKKNDVVWIPKNATYSVLWTGAPVQFFVLHFDFSPSFDPFFQRETIIQRLNCNEISALLEDFAYLNENGIEHYLSVSVFYRIFSMLYPLIEKGDKQDEQRRVIQPAIDYIETHYREKLSIKTLAELCYVSPSRFEHLFKKIMGVSPVTYKNNVVVQHIQRTLISNKSVSIQTLSESYGFESTVYFCRLFKQVTGLTPSQYRKTNSFI